MVRSALKAYDREMDPEVENVFKYRKLTTMVYLMHIPQK